MLERIERLLRRARAPAVNGADARYRLGVPSNIFSGALPEGVYYPDYTSLEDQRPLEFIRLAGPLLGKPWRQCTVLDIGCGEGTSTVALGRTGARVIGIEGRPAVVARARYLRDRLGYANVEFRTGNVLDESLWERADAVFVSGLIHHLDRPFRLMELIAGNCSNLAYFCTHLAPRDETHRAACHFSGLLHASGSMEFRGKALPGIRFAEGHGSGEETANRSRHPRHGIGNAYSWWPTEESFTRAMQAVGFPVSRRLAAHDHRLRYRFCFRRSGEIPEPAGEASLHYFWSAPERPHPETAAERLLAADTNFLKQAGVSPAVAGTPAAIGDVCSRLDAAGIRFSAIYVSGDAAAYRGPGGVAVAPHERLVSDGPEFVVIATEQFADLRQRVADLVTLRSCRYAFTSFSLAGIKTFPPLADPVTGESLEPRFPSSRWMY